MNAAPYPCFPGPDGMLFLAFSQPPPTLPLPVSELTGEVGKVSAKVLNGPGGTSHTTFAGSSESTFISESLPRPQPTGCHAEGQEEAFGLGLPGRMSTLAPPLNRS